MATASGSGSGSGSGRDDSRTFTTPLRQETFFNAARLTRTWWWDGSTKRHPPPYPYEYPKLPKPPSTSRTATKGHAVIAFWKNARHRQTSPAETSPAHHPLPFDKSSRFSNLNRVCLLHWILHPRHHRRADMSGYTTSEIQHTHPLQMFMYFDGESRRETALNEHMLWTLPWGNLASSSDYRKFMSELPTDPTIKATFEEGPVSVLLRPHTVDRQPASWPTVHDPWAPTVPTRLATRTARKSWKKIVRFKMGEPRARGESSACQVSPGGPIHAQCDMIRQDGPLGSGLCGLLARWTSDWGRRLQVRRASSKNAKKPKKRSWPAVPNNSPTGRRLRRHWLNVPSAILARWQAPLKFQRFTLRHPTLVALCLACLRKRRRDPCPRTLRCQPAPEVPATRLAHQPHNAPFPLRISQGDSPVVVWKPGDQESIFHLVSWRRQWPRCR